MASSILDDFERLLQTSRVTPPGMLTSDRSKTFVSVRQHRNIYVLIGLRKVIPLFKYLKEYKRILLGASFIYFVLEVSFYNP
jgi:hypothetical protein